MSKMTIKEAVDIWMPVVEMGVKDMPEVKEAVRMSIVSLEAWQKVRQDIQKETDDKTNNIYWNLGMLGALAIINKHLQEVLIKARECVCGQREQDYGTPESNFGLIANLWNAYLYDGSDFISPTDVAMMMSLLKIARIRNGGGTGDSFVDLAGYAACGGELNSIKKRKGFDYGKDKSEIGSLTKKLKSLKKPANATTKCMIYICITANLRRMLTRYVSHTSSE